MKQKSIVIGCYAILILIGGIIGHVVAHSSISLIISSVVAVVLLTCSTLIWKGRPTAYHVATAVVFCLFAFFSYRFFLTYKIAPSGILSLISLGLFYYLMAARKKVLNA